MKIKGYWHSLQNKVMRLLVEGEAELQQKRRTREHFAQSTIVRSNTQHQQRQRQETLSVSSIVRAENSCVTVLAQEC